MNFSFNDSPFSFLDLVSGTRNAEPSAENIFSFGLPSPVALADIEKTKPQLNVVENSIYDEELDFQTKEPNYQSVLSQSSDGGITQEKEILDSFSCFANEVQAEKENFAQQSLESQQKMNQEADASTSENKNSTQQDVLKRRRIDLAEERRTLTKESDGAKILAIIKNESVDPPSASNADAMRKVLSDIEKIKPQLNAVENSLYEEEADFQMKKPNYQSVLSQSSEGGITQEKEILDSFSRFANEVEAEKENFTQQFLESQKKMNQEVDAFYASITDPIEKLKMTRSKIKASRQQIKSDAKSLALALPPLQQKDFECSQLKKQCAELRCREEQLLSQIIENNQKRINGALEEISMKQEYLGRLTQEKLALQREVDSLARSTERDADEIIKFIQARDSTKDNNQTKNSEKALEYENIQSLYREFGSSSSLKSKMSLNAQDLEEMRKDLSYELKNQTYQFEQSKWKIDQREEQVDRLKERLSDINEQVETMDAELEEMNSTKLDDLSQHSNDSITVVI